MLRVVAAVLLLGLAAADIESEIARERGDITYRVSFKTQDVNPAGSSFTDAETAQRESFTSTGAFTIEIIGADGTTGPKDLIDHPSQVQTDNGWEVKPGMIQVAKIDGADVGEIEEVKIVGNNDDAWKPAWIKINANDFHTGLGNGIMYGVTPDAVKNGSPIHMKVEEKLTDEDDASPVIHKCQASFCKKAEHRYLKEGEDMDEEGNPEHEDFQHNFDNSAELIDKHGARYGPLGEGMPGTEDDHSMLQGHFMREFFMMGDLDEDDEDFLRTHSL